jgi:hypothetical protein
MLRKSFSTKRSCSILDGFRPADHLHTLATIADMVATESGGASLNPNSQIWGRTCALE